MNETIAMPAFGLFLLLCVLQFNKNITSMFIPPLCLCEPQLVNLRVQNLEKNFIIHMQNNCFR